MMIYVVLGFCIYKEEIGEVGRCGAWDDVCDFCVGRVTLSFFLLVFDIA